MRIAVDLQSTVGDKTGIGIYTQHLLKSLRDRDAGNVYIECKKAGWEKLNIARRMAWENVLLPSQVLKAKPDLLLVPGFAPPLLKPCKTVAVLHDLIGVLFPQNLGLFSRFYWSRWLPLCIKRADFIICDSESTRRDCEKILKVGGDKIRVVYPGIFPEPEGVKIPGEEQLLKKVGIDSDYILSLSTIEPRKNFPRLVEAWCEVKKTIKEKVRLVIVGKKGWGWPALEEKIKSLRLEDDVKVIGYTTEEEKAVLYKNCLFFVFPSIYEGFGLPVLEAMSFKKAVITSRASSMPEITGDCAVFIDPYDIKNISDAIIGLMRDRSLLCGLAQKGFERSKLFSWEKAARDIMDIFGRITKK